MCGDLAAGHDDADAASHGHCHHPPTASSHNHHHHHSRTTNDDKALGQRNKDHFDQHAATIYKEDWVRRLTDQIFSELRKEASWIGIQGSQFLQRYNTKMLDYACGDGVASRALSPYFAKVRGLDVSTGMTEEFNRRASEEGFSRERMHAINGNILDMSSGHSPELDTAEYHNFDLVVMSMALHHVVSAGDMIQKLADRLKIGGILLIVDFVHSSESGCVEPKFDKENPAAHTTSRMAFTEKEVKTYFEEAGLESSGWKWFSERSSMPEQLGEQQLFMAHGKKQAA